MLAIISAVFLSGSFSSSVLATDYSITMTTSGSVNINSTSGTASIDSSDINVITNCRAGYDLTLSTSVSDNNLYLNGTSTSDENSRFTPSNGTSALKDTPNTWGYSLSVPSSTNPSEYIAPTKDNTFYPVPSSSTSPAIIKDTSSTASETDINDNF